MEILKGSDQFFQTPAVKTLPPQSWRAGLPEEFRKEKRAPRWRPSPRSAPMHSPHAKESPQEGGTCTDVLDPRGEIDAALAIALGEEKAWSEEAWQRTLKEIAAVLEAAMPERLCTMPRKAVPAPAGDNDVFDISYQ